MGETYTKHLYFSAIKDNKAIKVFRQWEQENRNISQMVSMLAERYSEELEARKQSSLDIFAKVPEEDKNTQHEKQPTQTLDILPRIHEELTIEHLSQLEVKELKKLYFMMERNMDLVKKRVSSQIFGRELVNGYDFGKASAR